MSPLDAMKAHPVTYLDKLMMLRTTMNRMKKFKCSGNYDMHHKRSAQAFNRYLRSVGKIDEDDKHIWCEK